MTHKHSLCTLLLFVSCTLLLPACSSLTSNLAGYSTTSPAHEEGDHPTAEEIRYLDIEQEEDLAEELAALEKIGPWEPVQEETEQPEPVQLYDFPIVINKHVQFYLDQFQGRQRKNYARWLARSSKYKPYIEEQLAEAGLPKGLVFLAMIESGFNPSAYSHAHAAGLWQFIRGTGRNYGLRIDSWVDERREPEKATKAAIKYLTCLYDEFGDWYLAVAAYNAGEGRIGRAIKKYKTRDFWTIAGYRYLHLETKRYVPKLIAAIIIGRDPEKYGFTDIQYKSPVPYDIIEVPPATDLEAVAVSAGTSIKKLRTLNNELRKNQTPPGSTPYMLRIPDGTEEIVTANLSRLHPVITTAYKTHTVRKGDTITAVCRKYKINKTILLKANNLRTASLKKGQRLRIPYRTTKYVLLKEGETPESRFATAGKDGQMILHQLKRGETLSKLSKQYDVPVHIIMQWNNISNVRKIRAGDHLALYIGAPAVTAGSSKIARTALQPQTSTIAILKESKKLAVNKAKSNRAEPSQIWYQVQNGDSLWTIARKFQVSALELRRWNNLPSNLIHPGTRLLVKKV